MEQKELPEPIRVQALAARTLRVVALAPRGLRGLPGTPSARFLASRRPKPARAQNFSRTWKVGFGNGFEMLSARDKKERGRGIGAKPARGRQVRGETHAKHGDRRPEPDGGQVQVRRETHMK